MAGANRVGVPRGNIILDPGIGFGKSVNQNLEIIRNLERLSDLGFPLMVGTSRKSFIAKILNDSGADRIWGTGATVAAAVIFGTHVVRVHDVAAMRDVVRVIDALIGEEEARKGQE